MLTVLNCFRCLNACLIKDPWKQNVKEHREYGFGYTQIPQQTDGCKHACKTETCILLSEHTCNFMFYYLFLIIRKLIVCILLSYL